VNGMTRTLGIFMVLAATRFASAESVSFKSAEDDTRVCRVVTRVVTKGKVYASGGGGKTISHDLTARADFAFDERRLAPGGRDALAYRAARDFSTGRMETGVGDRPTTVEISPQSRLIVAGGHSGGITNYSPQGPLTRESLDLLEIPGDPLALSAILPVKSVNVDETWIPADWASQMLAAVEAVEKSTTSCKLASATEELAVIEVSGVVTGQRQGANCEVRIEGTVNYDRTTDSVGGAHLVYQVKSAVGAVSPGVEAEVDVRIKRTVAAENGRLTDALVKAIPISPEADAMTLLFDATPWGARMRHARDWYLFHAVMEGESQVAILRLIDRGSLIAQCNVSPIASVAPGQTTPLDQFEADIKASLKTRLKAITAREQVNVDNGMKVFRVVAEGQFTIKGKESETTVPTHWIYYLCTAPNGKQASFVFAVESQLLEQMGSKDEELVRSLQFVADRTAPTAKTVDRTGKAGP
jgi:hypothetical protein